MARRCESVAGMRGGLASLAPASELDGMSRLPLVPALLLALLLLPGPAPAQAPPGAPLAPSSRGGGAEARAAELDRAFEALRSAPDEHGAAMVEHRIRMLWSQAASPSVTLLLRRGMRNMEANLPAEALEDFDAALTLEPGFAESWHLRAQAHARTGDPAAAARDLQEALRLEPRHWAALLSLSALQEERGDAAAALRSLEAALAINPRMPRGAERLREIRRNAEGDAL